MARYNYLDPILVQCHTGRNVFRRYISDYVRTLHPTCHQHCFDTIPRTNLVLSRWSTQTFTIAQMTPIWIFPAYPMLIIGSHAAVLSSSVSKRRALQIIVGGTTIQGVGFLVSMTVYSAFIYRLMTQKLPKENLRPGMFVSVGPSAFTVAGLVGMANNAERAFPADFMGDGHLAGMVIRIVANFAALWLWGYVYLFMHIVIPPITPP